ncbi:MAG: PH domain-containing protein [Defluviitaleaceae bacterium]|nr:PH domain-containing protein [Defluviitaleaceae bacterium]
MPFFKKLTEEEKLAKQQEKEKKRQAQEEQARLNTINARLSTLENQIFPNMKNEKLMETIRNLDLELSATRSRFERKSVAKLEHILVDDLETLLGYAGGLRPYGQSLASNALLVFTTARIFIIDEESTHIISFTYDSLKSVDFKTKMLGADMKLYTHSKIYEVNGVRNESVEKLVQAINEAKDIFISNPDNFQTVTVTTETPKENEKSVTEQLNELKQLLYARSITQEEYDKMKAKILGK